MKPKSDPKRVLAEEFEYCVKKMKEAKSVERKLFYFTSSYGALSRVFNTTFDDEFVFMHFVLTNTYNAFMARLTSIRSGDTVIPLGDGYLDNLADCVADLAKDLRNSKNSVETLKRIALLGFATSGNGYYLLEKGFFTL